MLIGHTYLFEGEPTQARGHLEEALAIQDAERDREIRGVRFDQDPRAAAMVFLALTTWVLGERGQARLLIEKAAARSVETAHAPTLANTYLYRALLEALNRDAEAAQRAAESVLELSRELGIAFYQHAGTLYLNWARARHGEREAIREFSRALAAYAGTGNKLGVPFTQGLLAELEAEGHSAEEALARINEALAVAHDTGERWTDAFLHSIRGEILLKHGAINTAPAEEAFLTAIAIAQQQKARSFELRAALANLYQCTGRAADAQAVLASALEGFAPTPKFPEIGEAQTLLDALS